MVVAGLDSVRRSPLAVAGRRGGALGLSAAASCTGRGGALGPAGAAGCGGEEEGRCARSVGRRRLRGEEGRRRPPVALG